MKNITINALTRTRTITTILFTNFKRTDKNDNSFRVHKELLMKTDIFTKVVIFVVIYNHFEESFDNIYDAVICYNNYN